MQNTRVSAAVLLVAVATSGCSIRRIAVNKLGNALANSGTTSTGDPDPELVRDAPPFSLKLVEGLAAENPHRGLLLAASSGFTPYAEITDASPLNMRKEMRLVTD